LDNYEIAAFNGPFDLAVLLRRYPSLLRSIFNALVEGRIWDGRFRERLLDIAWGRGLRRKYNLGEVAYRRCGIAVDKEDPWRLRYGELIDVPISRWPPEADHYARRDGQAHLAVVWAQEQARYEGNLDLLGDAAKQARAYWALHLSSLWGVKTDKVAVEALDRSLKAEQDQCQARLQKAGLVRKDGTRDTKVTKEYAVSKGVTQRTPKGQVSLSEDTIKRVNDPLLNTYQRYGSLMTLRSRVVGSLRAPILRTFYDLVESGRTSSAHPNIQVFPREGGFRECLIPGEGNQFIIADYGGMELCTHAQNLTILFGHSELAAALRDGCDPHAELGAMLMGGGMTGDELNRRRKAGDEQAAHMRQCAKAGNFGFPGGLGVPRFLDYARTTFDVHLTVEQGYKIKAAWFNRWPENHAYFDWVAKHEVDGFIMMQQPVSGRIRGGCRYTEACNTPFQGLAADAAKDCLWRIACAQWIEPESPLYGTHQAMFVHDENVLESPAQQAESARVGLDKVMIETFADWCPDVPIKVESHVAERYDK
jgi:hypothetical protein